MKCDIDSIEVSAAVAISINLATLQMAHGYFKRIIVTVLQSIYWLKICSACNRVCIICIHSKVQLMMVTSHSHQSQSR